MADLVVFTDFEPYTYNAMHYAIDLAMRSSMQLVFCDSSNVSQKKSFDGQLGDFFNTYSHPALNQYFEHLSALFPINRIQDLKIQYKYQANFLVEAQSDIFLAFFSTKEKGGLLNRLFRDDFSKFLEEAKFPVFTVSKYTQFKSLKQLYLGTDLQLYSKDMITYSSDLANYYGVDMDFLHIHSEEMSNYLDQKKSFKLHTAEILGTDEFEVKKIERIENIGGTLTLFSKYNPSSLLVLGKSRKSVLDKLFLNNTTLDLAFSAHSPILIYPSEK